MRPSRLVGCIVPMVSAFFLAGMAAQASTITINVVTAFDYPGAVSTFPISINSSNQIVGFYEVAIRRFFRTHGFVRNSDGQFSDPLIVPNSFQHHTEAYGINNSGTICGMFDYNEHGFFLSNGTYTQYDAPGAANTSVNGINNVGDFVGTGDSNGFISVGGILTPLQVPGARDTVPNQLNSANRVAGQYGDVSAAVFQGFYTTRTGTLKYPVDAPGATDTELHGINNLGWMVGNFRDNAGSHGLFFIPPDQFATFDYPGAGFTFLTGINRMGYICGSYGDASGSHGFLAHVVVSP
jgi:hypothetical protein